MERSWLMKTNDTPVCLRSRLSSSITLAPTMVSRAEMTSSHSSTSGDAARARARFTRCFCPPESSSGIASGELRRQLHHVVPLGNPFSLLRPPQAQVELQWSAEDVVDSSGAD